MILNEFTVSATNVGGLSLNNASGGASCIFNDYSIV